ncbi:MAG: class I SAM-dependent methyltransferase [Thermoplasmata archaeon]|nr:class I SAM-dependent methyltransferase [Thermoplasmata archaeon]
MATPLKLYRELADWWPLISAPEDYADEARDAVRFIRGASKIPVRTLLELGSGGGNNASHLKRSFQLTLVDLSPGMLRVSRALNPECEHVAGDMRTVRLGRLFDAVFLHDAIMYMRTEADLRAALETASAHLRPGGVAYLTPDHTTESFRPSTGHGGHDERRKGGRRPRAARYLEWTLPPSGRASREYAVHYAFLLKDGHGSVHLVHDAHREGLFPRPTWLRLLREVGLVPRRATRLEGGRKYDVFLGLKPLTSSPGRNRSARG